MCSVSQASLGGVLTPYRGQQVLAASAARVAFAEELRSGAIGVADLPEHINFLPEYSPLHSHWTYAWLVATGAMPGPASPDAVEALFGVPSAGPVPLPVDDLGFRHWWLPNLSARVGFQVWPAIVLWWIATLVALAFGLRGYLRRA